MPISTFRFYKQCFHIARKDNSSFANDWQWVFGVPAVAAIIAGVASHYKKTPDMITSGSPILDGLIAGFGAYAITWLIGFIICFFQAPARLYGEKADKVKEFEEKQMYNGIISMEFTRTTLPRVFPDSGNIRILDIQLPEFCLPWLGDIIGTPGKECQWRESHTVYKCKVENHSNSVVSQINIRLSIKFLETIKKENGDKAGDIKHIAQCNIEIPILKGNAIEAFEFYVFNTGMFYVDIPLPIMASLKIINCDEIKNVSINSSHGFPINISPSLILFPNTLKRE